MPLVSTPDPGRSKTYAGPDGSLTEPVFTGLLKDWSLLGCVRIAAPEGEVTGRISGAASRVRCPNGTGWPAAGNSR